MEGFTVDKEIDYSQWQRRRLSMQKVAFNVPYTNTEQISDRPLTPSVQRRESMSLIPGRGSTISKSFSPVSEFNGRTQIASRGSSRQRFSLASIQAPFAKRELESACSSLCRHLPKDDAEKGKTVETIEDLDLLRTIKFQIRAKKQSILACKRRILNLIEENIKLKKNIQGTGASCHDSVRALLEKYQKLRDAMATIDSEHSKQKLATEKSLEDVKRTTDNALRKLRKRLDQLKKKLDGKRDNLKTLNNYKNKGYPEKCLKIKQLKNELQVVAMLNGKVMKEMTQTADVEQDKYLKKAAASEVGVLKQVALCAYDMVDINVKETANQNLRLKKEIDIQTRERATLEHENMELERKIKELIKEINELREKLFPGVYQKTETCSPNSESELSIPRKIFIPI